MPPAAAPRVAVLGAGPVGLEAALYARRLDLAVTVYEALAGAYPFDGPTPAAIVLKLSSEPAPPLSSWLMPSGACVGSVCSAAEAAIISAVGSSVWASA